MRLFRVPDSAVGAALTLTLALAQSASALNLTLSGPDVDPFTSGTAAQGATVGTPITFTVGLDAAPALNGYDVTIAWDGSELSFLSASELSGFGFAAAPTGATPAGERVAAISLLPVVTSTLFSVSFDVIGISVDGLRDFEVFVSPVTNGSGIAPGTLSLANGAQGAGIDVVPEPASGVLLAGALAALAALRRGPARAARGRRPRSGIPP